MADANVRSTDGPVADSSAVAGVATTEVRAPMPQRRIIRHGARYSAVPDSLRGLYERYCEREAMDLLSLMSRDALRHFYRRAVDWAQSRREAGDGSADPLAVARRYAREVLPLPPYDVWIPLYLANRTTFLTSLGIPSAPRLEDPVAVAVRSFGAGWYAALCVTGAGAGWSGFLQFHRSEGIQSCRTAEVFRGEDVDEIRARFDSFDESTLAAFLRSALP